MQSLQPLFLPLLFPPPKLNMKASPANAARDTRNITSSRFLILHVKWDAATLENGLEEGAVVVVVVAAAAVGDGVKA